MFQQENRLKDARVIRALFSKGNVVKTPFFICKYFVKESGDPKFSVVVSKKVSKSAVKRNRIIRRIREALRLNIDKCPPIDAVIFGSGRAEDGDYQEIVAAVLQLFVTIERREKK